MVQRFDWTPKRIEALKREYAEKGALHFANLWGMTTAAVAGRASRLGLKYVGLWKQATPDNDVGARAQMRRQQVAKIVRQMEAPIGKRGDSLEIVETVSARIAKPRQCSWIMPKGRRCMQMAVPGRMWCPCCQAKVDGLRNEAAA